LTRYQISERVALCRKLTALGFDSAFYAGFDRGIALKVLADEIGVTAFHSSEIEDERWSLDRLVEGYR
jgi:hypothetical protein